ncbi:MAG: methylated-DNA--[protein]-cysteine S-methyltransferase [Verrucomicrobia bacterium]|nr:methylated-DNA--[protein]-cysteine S-methyltransferase [Verrucomicrobiota bacterium]
MLRAGERALKAALGSARSGRRRSRGLRVRLDAVSPGGWKPWVVRWAIVAGYADSPFGRCLVGESPRGICRLAFVEFKDRRAEWTALQRTWPGARLDRDDGVAARWADRVFRQPAGAVSGGVLRAFVQGTAFQVRVWRALLEIPPGTVVSYGGLAAALGRSGGARAVGAAVGRNPLAWLVPCHRVIGAAGGLGGYRWGLARKRAMLAWESRQRPPAGCAF